METLSTENGPRVLTQSLYTESSMVGILSHIRHIKMSLEYGLSQYPQKMVNLLLSMGQT